mgnify:CR=1 FL=1
MAANLMAFDLPMLQNLPGGIVDESKRRRSIVIFGPFAIWYVFDPHLHHNHHHHDHNHHYEEKTTEIKEHQESKVQKKVLDEKQNDFLVLYVTCVGSSELDGSMTGLSLRTARLKVLSNLQKIFTMLPWTLLTAEIGGGGGWWWWWWSWGGGGGG